MLDTHHPTLAGFLRAGAEAWPHAVWCRTPDGETTRAAATETGRRVAAALRERGVEPGDRVILVLPNGLEFVHAWFGVVFVRAVAVAINPKAAASELPAVVAAAQPRLVVTADELGDLPATSAPVVRISELVGGDPAPWASLGGATPDEPVSFIQSSGSTGRPKLVIETNLMYTMAAEGFPTWLGLTSEDVMLTSLPLSHLNAQVYSLLGSYGFGIPLVLLPRFSASSFWEDVERFGATEFNAIGAMVEALMRQDTTPAEKANRVRICYTGPAPAGARHREMEERFGCRLVIGYALSESPYGLIVPVTEPVVYESMGIPRQHPLLGRVNEARLVDAEGVEVGDGVLGQLELRNPAISPGYFDNPEESARMRRDGWLRTGDLAVRDAAGHHYFAGRLKEIIRHRGENLSPTEVENVLDAHPAVAASAVIGVPSPMTEEDVKAYVMLKPGAAATAVELGAWCAERLPPYKNPRYIEFVDQFPLTETQKIAKRDLPVERNDNETDLVGR